MNCHFSLLVLALTVATITGFVFRSSTPKQTTALQAESSSRRMFVGAVVSTAFANIMASSSAFALDNLSMPADGKTQEVSLFYTYHLHCTMYDVCYFCSALFLDS